MRYRNSSSSTLCLTIGLLTIMLCASTALGQSAMCFVSPLGTSPIDFNGQRYVPRQILIKILEPGSTPSSPKFRLITVTRVGPNKVNISYDGTHPRSLNHSDDLSEADSFVQDWCGMGFGATSTGASAMSAGTPSGLSAITANRQISLAATTGTSGEFSGGFANGDFNGDGNLDTAAAASTGILVTLSKADGTTLSTSSYKIAGVGPSILAVDFNHDGILDLAVTRSTATGGGITVLLGKGDGTFGTPTDFPGSAFPFYLTTGDFNNDGIPDLAVTNLPLTPGPAGSVGVYLGKGDGTFAPQVTYTVGPFPATIVTGDFNGDGTADLAALESATGVSGQVNKIWVLIGKGDGTFQPAVSTVAGTGDGYLSYADLDHDGRIDAVIADETASAIAVMRGNGDGTFQPPTEYLTGANPGSVAPLPLEDGNTVLLTGDFVSGAIDTIFVRSDGLVQSPVLQALGKGPLAISAVDVNGDHQPDVVVTDPNSSTVFVKLATVNGQFGPPIPFPLGVTGPLASGDMNRDGKSDVVVATPTGVAVLTGTGSGLILGSNVSASGQVTSLAVADFNSDAKLDVVGANPTAGGVSLFLGNGDGTLQAAQTIPLANGALVRAVAVGDFNGDGKADLLVLFGVTNLSQPGGLYVLLGKGDGTFQSPLTIALPGALLSGALAVGDINGDGKPDAIAAINSNGAHQIAVLLGTGNGTFQPPILTNTTTAPPSITTIDLNGDGKTDLLLTDCCGVAESSFLAGNGDGTFQPELHFPSGPNAKAFGVADFDGDGRPDAAVIGQILATQTGTLAILFNTFSGTATGTSTTTVLQPATATYSPAAQQVTLTASVTSNGSPVNGGTVTFTLLGTAVATNVVNGTATTTFTVPAGTAAGNYMIQANYSPASGLMGSSDTKQLTISKAAPVITWATPSDIVSGTALGFAQLSATATVPGTFVYTPPAGTVLLVGNGQKLSVVFTPADSIDYTTQTGSVLINVTPSTGSTVLTASSANAAFSSSNQTVTLGATLTSSLGTVNGGTVTFTIAGVGVPVTAPVTGGAAGATFSIPANTAAAAYPIQALFSGAGQFPAATDNTKVLTIAKATPVIVWSNPADIVAGTPLGVNQLNASANVPGTFTYTPPAGTVLPVGNGQTLSAMFTPTDGANYNTKSASVLINVTPATGSTVVTASSANSTFSALNQIATLSATVTSSLGTVNAGTVTFTIPGVGSPVTVPVSGGSAVATFTIPGSTAAGSYPILVSYSGAGQFAAGADNTKSLVIGKATPVVTWANPADILSGTPLNPAQLNATASVPGTFTYAPPVGTVLPVGTGQALSVLFTPADTADYNSVTKNVAINVVAAASSGFAITNYTLVDTQVGSGGVLNLTYRADLINPGGAVGAVRATLASLDPFSVRVVPGQGILTFAPVPAHSQVTSGNTFTIITNAPLDPTKLLWTFEMNAAVPVADAGPNQTVKLGSLVMLDGSLSSNPSGGGTLTYDWMFTSRPPGTATRLIYSTGPTTMFVADALGVYEIQLTVKNGVATSTANVTVTVTP